jgi:hypothetical protein
VGNARECSLKSRIREVRGYLMRKRQTYIAPAVLALCLCFGSAEAYSLDDEARELAQKVYETKIMKCGESYYTSHPAKRLLLQYDGLTINVSPVPVTKIDKAEGVEWQGSAFITAKAHRQYAEETEEKWDDWRQGPVSVYKLPMRKTRGQWILYPVQEEPSEWNALRPIDCASIPR